jgi:hypothetical protein
MANGNLAAFGPKEEVLRKTQQAQAGAMPHPSGLAVVADQQR